MNGADSNIPEELWDVILSYLPVKSLLRFRLVSKSWKSIIDDPKFSSVHIRRCPNNTQNPYLIFCEAPRCGERRWVLRCSKTFQNASEIDFPAEGARGRTWEICNAVDGMILMFSNSSQSNLNENIVLWNPSIKKAFYLPPPNIDDSHFIHLCLLFDASNDDYKVVIIHHSRLNSGLIDVFSLKTLSWLRVVDENRSPVGMWVSADRSCVCIGGSAYWIGSQSEVTDQKVFSFDLTSNMISSIPIPTRDKKDGFVRKKVIVLSGSILGLLEEFLALSHITIWAMESSSTSVSQGWSKKYRIRLAMNGPETFCVPVQKRDVLLGGSQSLRLCDVKTGQLKLLLANYLGKPVYIDSYVESLVLLGACDRLRRRQLDEEIA